MDIEKIIEFLMEQQAKFDIRVKELLQNQQATERLINTLAKLLRRRSSCTKLGWTAWSGGWMVWRCS